MSAKSWNSSVIYAVDEIQNPIPLKKKICLKVRRIAMEGEMMSFQIAKGFGYRFNIA